MDSAAQLDDLQDELTTLVDQLGAFLGQLVAGDTGSGASSELDSQLGHNFRQYSALRTRHRDSSLSVAVLALTKSGVPLLQAAPVRHAVGTSMVEVDAPRRVDRHFLTEPFGIGFVRAYSCPMFSLLLIVGSESWVEGLFCSQMLFRSRARRSAGRVFEPVPGRCIGGNITEAGVSTALTSSDAGCLASQGKARCSTL